MSLKLSGKVAFVTGASRGIGRAIALRLASEGAKVALNFSSNVSKAEEVKAAIESSGGTAMLVQGDVSSLAVVTELIKKVVDEWGRLDILINNAGIDEPDLFANKDAKTFRKILDVNVIGAFNCAKRVYRHMAENKFGKIINISSTNGINTYYPMCLDYDASKAALNSLTHDLAMQYGPYINVNSIAPGFIGTEKELDGYDEEFLKEETEKIFLKRYGRPEEVAHLVRFLISDEAAYINNSIIRIDGGQYGSY